MYWATRQSPVCPRLAATGPLRGGVPLRTHAGRAITTTRTSPGPESPGCHPGHQHRTRRERAALCRNAGAPKRSAGGRSACVLPARAVRNSPPPRAAAFAAPRFGGPSPGRVSPSPSAPTQASKRAQIPVLAPLGDGPRLRLGPAAGAAPASEARSASGRAGNGLAGGIRCSAFAKVSAPSGRRPGVRAAAVCS